MPTKPLVLNETVSTTNILLTSIAENLAAIADADSSNARLASLAKEIADEAKTVAMGATRAEVFDTTELMQNWLKDPENAGKLKIGDNLYIKDTNVPDYWVSNVLTNPNDEGYYYEYAQLEIGKVNLSNVVKTDADDADTVDSVFGMLEGTPKNISSANLASVVAQGIHDSADAQKLVTFGAGSASELGTAMYGAADASALASVVAGEILGAKILSKDCKTVSDGIYAVVRNGYDTPFEYGVIWRFGGNGYFNVMVGFSYDSKLYIRFCNNNTWLGWVEK